MGANVLRTDAARHRRPHGSIQKEDFAEFGVNFTDATKWFHIMQKKKTLLIKDKHCLHTLGAQSITEQSDLGESQQGLCQGAAKAKSQRGQAVTKSH